MTTSRVGVMAAQRWELLMQTAAREFAVAGYEHASLNRIIRACGMSKSSFYHYVRSKQQLFDLVADHLGRELTQDLHVPSAEELRGPDFWELLDELMDQMVEHVERDPTFADLGRMFYLPGAPTGDDSAVGRWMILVQTWIDRALAAGRDVGAVRADLPASLQGHLTVAILRAVDEWALDHDFGSGDARGLTREVLAVLRRLLEPDDPAGR